MKLENRIAVVTGAGRGIGRAIADKLGAEGAKLVINDLDADVGEAAVSDLRARGVDARLVVGSVSAQDFPAKLVDATLDAFGVPDIVVNNAGYTWDATIANTSDEHFDAMLDVHLRAPFRILRAFHPAIREAAKNAGAARPHRKVVNVSSLSGTAGAFGQTAYSAAKAGVIGLTKALAREWGRYGVCVNCVAFGYVHTRLTQTISSEPTFIEVEGRQLKVGAPSSELENLKTSTAFGRGASVEEAAGAVYALCIPETDYVTGELFVCSGGLLG